MLLTQHRRAALLTFGQPVDVDMLSEEGTPFELTAASKAFLQIIHSCALPFGRLDGTVLTFPSYDPTGMFCIRLTRDDALGSEAAQVEAGSSARYQLGEMASDGMTLLETVAAETGGLVETPYAGPFTDDGVGVEPVLRIQA